MSVQFQNPSPADGTIKKRKRQSLVCENCKKKKIRCDKGEPCSQCVRSKLTDSCHYSAPVSSRLAANRAAETSLPYISSAKTPLAFGKKVEDIVVQPLKKKKLETESESLASISLEPVQTNQSSTSTFSASIPASTSIGTSIPNSSIQSSIQSSAHLPLSSHQVQVSSQLLPQTQLQNQTQNSQQYQYQPPPAAPPAPIPDELTVSEDYKVTVSLSELNMLKQRLQQIESSIVASSSATPPIGTQQNSHQHAQQPQSQQLQPQSYQQSLQSQQYNSDLQPQREFQEQKQQQHHQHQRQYQHQQKQEKPTRSNGDNHLSQHGSSSGIATSTRSSESFSSVSSISVNTPQVPTRNEPIQLPPIQFRNSLPPSTTPNGPPILPPPPGLSYSNGRGYESNTSGSTRSHPTMSNESTGAAPTTANSSPDTSIKQGLVDSPASILSSVTTPSSKKSLFGLHPYADENERINFYADYTSIHIKEPERRINFGPFAWSSLMKKDKGLSLLWDYIIKKKEEKSQTAMIFTQVSHELTQENTNVATSQDVGESEKSFKRRALEVDGYTDMIPYNSILKAKVGKNIQKTKLNENTLPLGLTYYDGQLNRELQLIEKIHMILPTKLVLWKLVRRFFTWLYPFMPFIDEECFKDSITSIIGPVSYEDVKITELKVEKRLDLAHIGLLLVVLRLAYLSLFCNSSEVNEANLKTTDPSPKKQEMKYLLSSPIDINTVDIAQECLDQFNLLRKTSFIIFQLGFYIRLYHIYAPEDGDGADGGDSQVLNAILIQMAYSLGLNREPDNFKDILNNPKTNNLGRKMWNYLLLGDLHISYSNGMPMVTDPIYSDTRAPVYEPGSENISDITLDRYVSDCYFECGQMSGSLRKVLRLVLNVQEGANMADLCKSLTEFEYLISEHYGTLEECLKPLEENEHWFVFTRNFRTKFYLALKAFYVSIYYHFYLYYETKDINLSFFYLKKMLIIAAYDIMPHYFDLLGGSEIICDMIVNPTLEQIIHKCNQLTLALIIRINFVIYHMKNQTDHNSKCLYDSNYATYYRGLCRFSSCLTRSAEVSIAAISKISNRYYYAWRITKGHTYLLKNITTMEFYDENYSQAGSLCLPRFTLDQIEDMINICEASLSKLGKVDLVGNEFCNDTSISSMTNNTRPVVSNERTSAATTSDVLPDSKANADTKTNDINLEFVNNKEIDNLWFQMLSMKYDNQEPSQFSTQGNVPENRKPSFSFGAFSPGPMGGFKTPNPDSPMRNMYGSPKPDVALGGDIDRYGFDMEQAAQFDIFSELPFDQVFK
ncbi:hypothetical protein G9P44_000093 [Scheffersomyces stipitis]|nr:hypothetical protein G9P44_000093 [Scheffersomyces stipitis]